LRNVTQNTSYIYLIYFQTNARLTIKTQKTFRRNTKLKERQKEGNVLWWACVNVRWILCSCRWFAIKVNKIVSRIASHFVKYSASSAVFLFTISTNSQQLKKVTIYTKRNEENEKRNVYIEKMTWKSFLFLADVGMLNSKNMKKIEIKNTNLLPSLELEKIFDIFSYKTDARSYSGICCFSCVI
jgi:hypothetical protein